MAQSIGRGSDSSSSREVTLYPGTRVPGYPPHESPSGVDKHVTYGGVQGGFQGGKVFQKGGSRVPKAMSCIPTDARSFCTCCKERILGWFPLRDIPGYRAHSDVIPYHCHLPGISGSSATTEQYCSSAITAD
eukprot:3115777-Rhodomonas_salina.1